MLRIWLGTVSGTSVPIAAPAPFVLAGIEWAAPRHVRIELRARSTAGRWSGWVPASALGHEGDGAEGIRHAFAGQPAWFGVSDAVQLRADRRVEGVSAHLVVAAAAGAAPAARDAEAVSGALPLAAPRLPAGPGQPPIIARHAWAGTAGPAQPPAYGDVRMAFVHHTDNPNGYGRAEVPAMLQAIYQYHRYVNGWNDIGYNFIIDLYGQIWEARAGGIDQAVIGAQAGGYNAESTGVAVLGTFSGVVPTPVAMSALEALLGWKLALHGVPTNGRVVVEVDPAAAYYTPFRPGQRVSLPRIAGHRDGCSTDCPGAALYARLPAVRAAVARRRGISATATLTVHGGRDARAAFLSLAAAQIVAGEPVTLSGTCRVGGGSGGSVLLQSLAPNRRGHAVEEMVAESPVAADGTFSATLAPTRNLLVRALRRVAPAVASPLVAIAVAPNVTLAASAAGTAAGGVVELQGSVSPPKPKVEVDVLHATGHHRLVKTVTVSTEPDGGFAHRLRLRAGRYWLIARTGADAANIAGASARVAVAV